MPEKTAVGAGGPWEGGEYFATTRWSVVRAAAGGGSGAPGATDDALEQLCRLYWRPVVAYLRRRGYAPADAQDHTQDFFSRLLAGNILTRADPAKGRFRSYLLSSLEYDLNDARDLARAQKRGGKFRFISLDEFQQESEHLSRSTALSHAPSPREAYEVRWAESLLARSRARLQEGLAARGRPELYPVLAAFLSGAEPDGALAQAATRLGLSVNATKVAIHRLRVQYRVVLREEVALTLDPATPAAIDAELRYLAALLTGAARD